MPHWAILVLYILGVALSLILTWRYGRTPTTERPEERLPDYSEGTLMDGHHGSDGNFG